MVIVLILVLACLTAYGIFELSAHAQRGQDLKKLEIQLHHDREVTEGYQVREKNRLERENMLLIGEKQRLTAQLEELTKKKIQRLVGPKR